MDGESVVVFLGLQTEPPLDPAIDEDLKAFISKRKEEEKSAA